MPSWGSAFPERPLPIPRLERRPASGAEPAGRRGALPTSDTGQRNPGCGRGRPRSQGKTGAHAPPEDTELGLGVPREALPTSGTNQRNPGCGRGRPRSQGKTGAEAPREEPIRRSAFPGRPLPIPRLERRPASGAEPAGRRGALPTSGTSQRNPGCGRGRPRSQGKTGADAPREEPIRRSAFPGGPLPIPRLERRPASGVEPAGRREAKHTSTVGQHAPGMRAGTPALPGEDRR
jgi:hypothetical protein